LDGEGIVRLILSDHLACVDLGVCNCLAERAVRVQHDWLTDSEQIAGLRANFQTHERKVLAVERLNQLELGATVEGALRSEYHAMLDRLSVCPDKDYAKVDQNPVCPLCRFAGKDHVPKQEVEVFAKRAEKAVSDLEREFVLAALQRSQWNVTRAAQDVGIARPNFQALMRKHGIRSGDKA
jgi:transcriptional regulator with GAF, ATPase, and Fis domain